jgi:hypothetical protein
VWSHLQLQEGQVCVAVVSLVFALLHNVFGEYIRCLGVVPVEAVEDGIDMFRPLARVIEGDRHVDYIWRVFAMVRNGSKASETVDLESAFMASGHKAFEVSPRTSCLLFDFISPFQCNEHHHRHPNAGSLLNCDSQVLPASVPLLLSLFLAATVRLNFTLSPMKVIYDNSTLGPHPSLF